MKKYLVIGNPIDHSLSPLIHNFWIKKHNLNATYEKQKLELDDKQALKSYALKTTETAIMPSIDAEYMAKQVVGRYHWNNSKKSEREAFVKAYKKVITDEYAKFLLSSGKSGKKENQIKN